MLAVLPAELDGCHLFLGPGRPSNCPVCTSGRLFRHLSCSLALRSQRLTWPLALCMGARGASTDSLPEPSDQVQTFPERQTVTSQTAIGLPFLSGWQLLCWDLPLQTVPPVPPHPAPPASNPSASLCWVLGSFSPDSLHCVIFLAYGLVTLGSSLHVTYLKHVFFLNFQIFLFVSLWVFCCWGIIFELRIL